MIAGSGAEAHKLLRIRLVSSSYPSDPVQILSAWVSRLGGLDCSEGSIVRHISGGQAAQNYLISIHSDGAPIIIQDCRAGCGDSSEILFIYHPLVIAEGEECRGDGGAGRQERQDIGLCLQR